MENPINMDDLGVPLFSETPIYVRRVYRGLYTHWQLDTSTKLLHDRAWHPEQWSRAPGCGLGRGWNITQSCGDYFINREIRIPSKKAGFHGKYPAAFFVFVAQMCQVKFWFLRRKWSTAMTSFWRTVDHCLTTTLGRCGWERQNDHNDSIVVHFDTQNIHAQ